MKFKPREFLYSSFHNSLPLFCIAMYTVSLQSGRELWNRLYEISIFYIVFFFNKTIMIFN